MFCVLTLCYLVDAITYICRHIDYASSGSSNINEEGLEIAVWRHGMLLGALNMYRGEIFAYPLYLQKKLVNREIMFFCMNATCKYWPYLCGVAEKSRVKTLVSHETIPLSVSW